MAINMDGNLWVIATTDHVKPGKGPAYTQVKLKGVTTSGVIEKRLRGSEEVDKVDLDRREMEYLYSDADGGVFMDQETFDQHTVPQTLIEDDMVYMKANTVVTGLFHNDQIISIELPATVDLEITDTPPQIKGATATNQLKEATCETGLKTRVPPFIKPGEVVRVSTETGDYMSRV